MASRHLISAPSRTVLFDPPADPAAIVAHYTLSPEDLALIGQRRRDANRLGFAVHLAYLRFPGRVLAAGETPPAAMVAFIAEQLGIGPEALAGYAGREETRWEHLGELQAYLGVRPFSRADHRPIAAVALQEATGTDRGDKIMAAMIGYLRDSSILLPAATVLERIGLAARARARKQAYKMLTLGLGDECRQALERLLAVTDATGRTSLAWLRDWSEAPTLRNLAGIIERLKVIRSIGLEPGRHLRIHQARYAALVKEAALISAQHAGDASGERRLALLTAFAVEQEVILTDAGIAMFTKMLGSVLRRADRKHREQVVIRARAVDGSFRTLLRMAKAMIEARAAGGDPAEAIERSIGWEPLAELVREADDRIGPSREDNLAEVVSFYPTVRRMTPALLEAFTFRSWKANDPLLAALEWLRVSNAASGQRTMTPPVPTAFLPPAWRKLVGTGAAIDRRAYQVAVMMQLRDRLHAGDIWVEGSRAFRTFNDFLLPPAVFRQRRQEGALALAVPNRFEEWRDPQLTALGSRLREVDTQAARNELPDAVITEAGLSISPIRGNRQDASVTLARRLYAMLPRLRITDLFAEVHEWTGFAVQFAHLRTGTPPDDIVGLMTVVLADATNLGLSRMARSSLSLSHTQLVWTERWHIRDETYAAALAGIVEAIHAHPFTALWGDGDTSSSDGQFFKAGGHGEARAEHNARYGSEPGVKFYTHVSDRFGPFHTKVIAANASEAAHILDGLLHHETTLSIREHYTDTAGAADHVFGLCHLLGFRFAPRIRDLADRRLYAGDGRQRYGTLAPMMGGTVNLRVVEENWDEVLRLAASVRAGTVPPSTLLRRLAAYPRQNALAKALREIGRVERTRFTLDWITDPALRRRSQAGLNKGEARNALARTLFFHRHGEIRDRTCENQRYRASGLNLAVAAVILWNTVYLARAVDALRAAGEEAPNDLLAHIAPLGWEHIIFNGNYIWPETPLKGGFRPLRNPKANLLEAA
jgi:TnpA family transposase